MEHPTKRVFAKWLAVTLLAAALTGCAGRGAPSPTRVVIYDHGQATAVEPQSSRFRSIGEQAAQLVSQARDEIAALGFPWEAAARCTQEQVAVEVVFAEPGVQAGVHGTYTSALIPLDQEHELGLVSVYLGRERYTLLVPARGDEALACVACDGQLAATPTATPAGTTLATVPPTASPSPTPSPAPPATRQSIPLHGMNSSPAALFRTGDGGAHWTQVASTNDTLPYGGRVRCAGPMTAWLSGVEASTRPLSLSVTPDGGQTWEALPGTPGLAAFLQGGGDVLQLDFVSAQVGWAIVRGADGQATQLAETHDGGRSWGLVDAQMAR